MLPAIKKRVSSHCQQGLKGKEKGGRDALIGGISLYVESRNFMGYLPICLSCPPNTKCYYKIKSFLFCCKF